MKDVCSLQGCNRPRYSRGWCRNHYRRWNRTGNAAGRHPQTRLEAIAALKTSATKDGTCITWCGYTHPSGYGQIYVDGKSMRVHRFAWEVAYGPLDTSIEVDHVCHNRACINPVHLRLATRAQNCRNRSGAQPNRTNDLPRNVTRSGKSFQVQVGIHGKKVYGGLYSTVEAAERAAAKLRQKLFGEFAGNQKYEEQADA